MYQQHKLLVFGAGFWLSSLPFALFNSPQHAQSRVLARCSVSCVYSCQISSLSNCIGFCRLLLLHGRLLQPAPAYCSRPLQPSTAPPHTSHVPLFSRGSERGSNSIAPWRSVIHSLRYSYFFMCGEYGRDCAKTAHGLLLRGTVVRHMPECCPTAAFLVVAWVSDP